ncbi:MAG TPA: SDR family oxidoreductase [Pirellulales bacterium]|nr:SDR family oxidoreductase [Pirellulales bacterium]
MDAAKKRALVTGASSGFGAEIARVLAQRGFNLVIAARRRDRLETLAEQFRREHHVDVAVFASDLSTSTGPRQLFDVVRAAGLQIDILVNNAGLGHFGPFLEQSLEQIEQMIAVDVSATTALTRLYAQAMVAQGYGRILQVSSFAALQPIPRYSVYSAAKAYLVALAQGLQHELRKTGVRISVVAPGFMKTEFHDVALHERTFLMKLTNVPVWYTARRAVVGMLRGKLLITPGPVYQINGVLVRFLPRRLASAISALSVGGKQMSPEIAAQEMAANERK